MSKVPLIGGTTEQKLIISFKKRETGEGDISSELYALGLDSYI